MLGSLLAGLAAKITLHHAGGVPGLCASWRCAYQFVQRRGYPSKWWRRPLALAALRQEMPLGVLPRALRLAAAAWTVYAGCAPENRDCNSQGSALNFLRTVRACSAALFSSLLCVTAVLLS